MQKTYFMVGTDAFEDIQISSKPDGDFHWLYDTRKRAVIAGFVLGLSRDVFHVCSVTLIKKRSEKFTPRIAFSIRHRKTRKIVQSSLTSPAETPVKASVDLSECHKHFWDLISYLKSVADLDIPDARFSLVAKDVAQIVNALSKRDHETVKRIIELLSSATGVTFSEQDVNGLLRRKERLAQFRDRLAEELPERDWQTFFDQNKWIFGYGLNYVIIKIAGQPHVGGGTVSGAGVQKADFLGVTVGDVRFTVLVEIKTPKTLLLRGEGEVRNGAWGLSQELTDSLVQTQANIDRWNREGARSEENRARLEDQGVYTVKPKGIVVIGSLSELKDNRHKLQTFERFRKSIHDIEILTFDEIYERARYIVDHSGQ